jgi:hypothetical protein
LALTSDTDDEGWSYDVNPGGNSNADLVALVRNDMVIAYQRFPAKQVRRPPYVRGTFVVADDDKVSSRLKMAEGHLHNSWKTDEQQTGSEEVALFASGVLTAIGKKVSELRKRISFREDSAEFRIRAFDQVFSGKGPSVTSAQNQGDPPPPPPPKIFDVELLSQEVLDYSEKDPTKLRFLSRAAISLSTKQDLSALKVEVDLGWRVFEEAGPVRDDSLADATSIVAPDGFAWEEGRLVGLLTGAPVEFEWTSAYFPDDWRVLADPRVVSGASGDE